MTARLDLSAFTPALERFAALTRTDLVRAILSPEFARNVAIYLTTQMDRAVSANGNIAEGDTRIVRGQTWRGWAQRSVKKYGAITVDGTRYYMRKFARGSTAKKSGATWKQADRAKKWGVRGAEAHLWSDRSAREAAGVASRPFEQVWRRRASGKRYSASSKLMQDTGAMRQAWMNIQTAIVGNTVEFRPANNVRYFARQNELRPIFVIEPAKDVPAIVKLVEPLLAKLVA